MKSLERTFLIQFLFLFFISYSFSQTPNCTNTFHPFALTNADELCLTNFNPNTNLWELGGNIDGFNVTVLDVAGNGEAQPISNISVLYNNPAGDNTANNWSNLPEPYNTALDALRIIEIGTDRFEALELGSFLVNDTEIQIDAFPDPSFNLGPYTQSGIADPTNGPPIPDRVFLPNINLQENITAEILAHEIGHLYLNVNHNQLQNVSSNESIGIYEFLADMIGFEIDSSVPGNANGIDWQILTRDYRQEPDIQYNLTEVYQLLPPHEMALTGGHWAWSMVDNECFDFHDLFVFLINCTSEDATMTNDIPEVIDYLTLRNATIEHYFNQFDLSCSSICYQNMVNTWNSVGVGSAYSPQRPILVENSLVTGPCSVSIEWEDQGVPRFNVIVTEIDDNGTDIREVIDECIMFDNSFQLNDASLSPGEYRIRIAPACDDLCFPISDPLIETFFINSVAIPEIDLVVATTCDMIIETEDIGLGLENYQFTYQIIDAFGSVIESINIDLENVIEDRFDGKLIFYIDEPFQGNQNGFQVGMLIQVNVITGCVSNNIVPLQPITIINDLQNLGHYELLGVNDPGFEISKCNVQPVINVIQGQQLNNLDFLRARLAEITATQFNELSALNADLSHRANQTIFNPNINPNPIVDADGYGPNIPMLPLQNNGTFPKFYAMNLQIQSQLNNSAHPLFPKQFCHSTYNTDLVLFSVTNPPNNCTSKINVIDIDICFVGENIELDFTLDGLMEDISHIEYRYKFQNHDNTMWSACNSTVSENNIFTEPLLFSSGNVCLGNLEVQARVVCNCNTTNCTGVWSFQSTVNNTCPPAAPIDQSNYPLNPEYSGASLNGNQITMDYNLAPNVHSYRAWYRPLNGSETVIEEQRIECNIADYECIDNEIVNFAAPEGDVSECQIGRTIRFNVPNGNVPYRVYLESLCCETAATCDDNMNLSDCFLVVDVAAACTLDETQELEILNFSSSEVSINWQDEISESTSYIISAEPILCSDNQPVVVDLITIQPNVGPNDNTYHGTISNLMPNTEYQITLSKNCGNILCVDCTIDIKTQVTTSDLEIEIIPICDNNPGEIRLSIEGVELQPSYNFFVLEDPNAFIEWDNILNEFVIEIESPGSFHVSIIECEELIWEVQMIEDTSCLIPDLMACGTLVHEQINLDLPPNNFISQMTTNFPHYWDEEKLVIENQIFHFEGSNSLILDVDVEFRNCEIYMDAGNQIEVREKLFLTDNTVIDQCNTLRWGGLVMEEGSSLYMTNSSLLNVNVGIHCPSSIEEIAITGSSNLTTSTIHAGAGIRSTGASNIITLINIHGANFDIFGQVGIDVNALDVKVSNTQISSINRAIEISNALNVEIVNHCILESRFPITILNSESINISNNALIRSTENSAISITRGNVTIKANDIIQSGGGNPAIDGLALRSCNISANHDIIGAVEIDGVQNETEIFYNRISSPTNGIDLQEADNAAIRCNDITSINNSIHLTSNCVDTDLFGNVLNFGSENDLFSEQSTFFQELINGEKVHRGNCFQQSNVVASFLDPTFLIESTFEVDPSEQECFIPLDVNVELFREKVTPELTQQCVVFPQSQNTLLTENDLCVRIKNIETLLNDPNLSQVGILRMLRLLKNLKEKQSDVPHCVKTFMDTTAYCSFNVFEKFYNINSKRKEILFEYQIQSSVTHLYLKLWQNYEVSEPGNSQENKNDLYKKYLAAKSKLLEIADRIQRENEDILNYVNSSAFPTCLDSISVLKRKSLTLELQKGEFRNSEKNYIIRQARLCSKRYGYVIHEYRALASQFSSQDFRKFDNCTISQRETSKRSIKSNKNLHVAIIPNPATHEFQIKSFNKEFKKIIIYSLDGNIIYKSNTSDMHHIINSSNFNSGVYFIKIIYTDLSDEVQKLIIL